MLSCFDKKLLLGRRFWQTTNHLLTKLHDNHPTIKMTINETLIKYLLKQHQNSTKNKIQTITNKPNK